MKSQGRFKHLFAPANDWLLKKFRKKLTRMGEIEETGRMRLLKSWQV